MDSELLAEVYLELLGGRQHGLSLLSGKAGDKDAGGALAKKDRPLREARPHHASEDELAQHAALLEKLNDPLWKQMG
mgnify:FL=1